MQKDRFEWSFCKYVMLIPKKMMYALPYENISFLKLIENQNSGLINTMQILFLQNVSAC
jgi:hypothetical protein